MSISVRGLLHLSAALSLVFALACAQAATLSFEPVQIAGVEMKLPKGWQQHRDDYSLILTEQPNDPASAILALFALSAGPGAALTAEQLADAVQAQLDLERHGISAHRLEQRQQGTALYRLLSLSHPDMRGYLASYTFTDAASGALIHMFHSAPEQRFIDLGGPVLPLVVFGGLDVSAMDEIMRHAQAIPSAQSEKGADDCAPGESLEVCLAGQWFGTGGKYAAPSAGSLIERTIADCEQRKALARTPQAQAEARHHCDAAYANASRISAMSHQTSMKIARNIGGGWCYRGESDCH